MNRKLLCTGLSSFSNMLQVSGKFASFCNSLDYVLQQAVRPQHLRNTNFRRKEGGEGYRPCIGKK